MNRIKNREWTRVVLKGKQFLLHYWHTRRVTGYNPGDNNKIVNEGRTGHCLREAENIRGQL
jgi:hypothetical protein